MTSRGQEVTDQTATPAPADRPPVQRAPGLAGLLGRLPRPLRIGIPLVVVAAVALTVLVLQRQGGGDATFSDGTGALGPQGGSPPATGEPAPDFTLRSLDGATVKLSSLRGTPVLLNFWATWCGPCRAEMPDLQAAYDAANGAFIVLGVNAEGTTTELATRLSRDYRDELGLTFPIVVDSPDTEVFNQYRLRGMPDTFFIDKDGIIRDVVVGPLNQKSLDEKLRALLGK